jgi:ABC-type nitrate/sulfonate/bicarbonate transport system substrate-binding protein
MLAGFGQVLPAVEKGAKLKVLGGANTLTPNSLFSVKPEIKALTDLEGKTIGTGSLGSVLHQVTVALLQKNKIDPAKVTFVNVGSTADILKAVVAGTVDAGTVNVDTYGIMDKYKIHPIADFFKQLQEYPFQGSFASETAIKTKREAIVRTLAAHAKLFRFISGPTSKDDYVAAYVTATGGSPDSAAAQWQFIQDSQPYAIDLVLPEKNVQYMQQLNVQMGVQQKILPNEQVADMSLAEEAIKLLKA